MLFLLKISPFGWEDENGFHQIRIEEKLISFPLKKRVAGNLHTVNLELAPYQKLDNSNSDHQITLGL